MKKEYDIFRPRGELAGLLYDAFQKEAEQRPGRTVEEWKSMEEMVVWETVKNYAVAHGLKPVSLTDVTNIAKICEGYADFAKKWAIRIVSRMEAINNIYLDQI